MNKHIQKLIFSIALFLLSNSIFAQHTVKGVITDKADGLSIPGTTVILKGTTNGTITDFEGNYSITVTKPTDTLAFSCIGYETIEIPINGRATIDVVMMVEHTELEELVVIGYGIQKKKVVTGAIASVDADEIAKTPILRVEQAMQGRTAGVQVTQMSGQPGEAPTVRIRGTGTTGDANPLYIIDGMPVSGIDYLNPGDIESMDVLKDAASCAIYGARGANGVVLITTKGSGIGQKSKMSVSYSGYYGIQNVANTLDMLNADQYRELMNQGARNANQDEPFDMNEVAHNTDWQSYIFEKNVPIVNHDINVSGGNEKSFYSSSISYFSQQGIIGGSQSQFDRLTARLNSSHKVTNWFKFGNTFAYSSITKRGIGSNESFNGVFSSALNLDPLTPLYETDPDILAEQPYSNQPVVVDEDGNVYGISNYLGAEIVNPQALLEIQTSEYKLDKIVGNVFAEISPFEGLVFKTSMGIDLAYGNGGSYKPLYYMNGAQYNTEKTSVNKYMQRWYNWQIENTLTYSKKIKDHNFSVLAGTTAKEDRFDDLSGFNAMVSTYDPENVYLNMASDTAWKADGGASHYALYSVFGRITYDYKSKYAFTGILRRDGSSNFGANNRFGIFPSLGVSWLISDESFFPQISQLSFAKLRASWGINGNDNIGPYKYISVMSTPDFGYIFGGGRLIGMYPEYIENADIKWEESEQIDIALDFGAYNDRLTATFDFYIKNTNDLLEIIPIPAHVGNSAPYSNVGSVQNKGIEMSVNWRHTLSDMKYSFGVNAAYNKNTMTHIGNSEGIIWGADWAVAGTITRAEEGLPISHFYGYQTDGLFQNETEVYQHIGTNGELLQPLAEPGDVRFVDVNGDNEITPDDRTMIGNPTPDWTLGFNGSLDYKQFDISFLIFSAIGHDIFNGSQRQDLFYTNRTTEILDSWTGEGTSDEIPRYTWSDVNNNYRVSDLYIEDGTYVRLKNLQIGYNLPNSILNKIKATNWRFYISGENLITITGYSGADPEIGARSSFDIGIDRGIYPQARTFRLGTTLTF
ncbi:MAG: TonB-dependent receptor [Bacteroidetes bacterium]|jgi:TonB-linked SusC/RagA family outer membrane protein|nr:TonB-dependent receptor [Bacteroidota bacterium]MBT6685006.1 TonB-dependent receptor [Bacteroidota bacterium]MBT7143084.1 TonB-dependent receptor [Bacteroidota bacterium]MBT7491503.1 TonB-dependent receptor [Bacteroidota bacterium]